jgi:hypothetical protein
MEPTNVTTAIVQQLAKLQHKLSAMRISNAELRNDLARVSTVLSPQCQEDSRYRPDHYHHGKHHHKDDTISTHSACKSKLKAPDLQEFYSRDIKDIDQWI